eukprot:6189282-Pleurochrysis_carterae.AAC.1
MTPTLFATPTILTLRQQERWIIKMLRTLIDGLIADPTDAATSCRSFPLSSSSFVSPRALAGFGCHRREGLFLWRQRQLGAARAARQAVDQR